MYTMIRQPHRRFIPQWHGHAGLGDAFSVADIQSDIQSNGCADVKAMQMGLNQLGYAQPALVVDGVVGAATAQALTNFGINSNPTVNSNWCAAVASAVAQKAAPAPGQAPTAGKTLNLAAIRINPALFAYALSTRPRVMQSRSGIIASAEDAWATQSTPMKIGIAVGGVAAVGLIAYLLIK